MKKNPKIIPLILCGGAGMRLWPLSNEEKPKQYLPLINKSILLHDTVNRAMDCSNACASEIVTITTERLAEETRNQLSFLNPDLCNHVLFEPESKDTAAAIAFGTLYIHQKFGEDAHIWVLPSDHYVDKTADLKALIRQIISADIQDKIITLGIKPSSADTNYGYIQYDTKPSHNNSIFEIKKFSEKPEKKDAETYYRSPDYLWNSGMFLGTAKTFINEFIEHCPQIIEPIHKYFRNHKTDLKNTYTKLPKIPFDRAIMEKTSNAVVVPCNIGWNDVGSWHSIWDLKEKDLHGNAINGDVEIFETQNCLIESSNMLVATMGIEGMAIVQHENTLLIADKNNMSSMKQLSKLLKDKAAIARTSKKDFPLHPGEKDISLNAQYKTTEVIIKPKEEIRPHTHKNISEMAIIIEGTALIEIDGKIQKISKPESIFIPSDTLHSIKNIGSENLKIINFMYAEDSNKENNPPQNIENTR